MESDASRTPTRQNLPPPVTKPSIAGTEDSSHESDQIFTRLGKLEASAIALTDPKFISSLYSLKDRLQEWRIRRDQKKFIKRIFSDSDRRKIEAELKSLEEQEASSSQPNLLQLDRNTFYKNKQIERGEVSDEREKELVRWLLGPPVDFKAVGISGTGDSGQTALVKNVLKQESIRKNFKCIIWASLSESAGDGKTETEDEVRIIEYSLYRLGLDPDNLVADVDEDRKTYTDWLMKELKHRLRDSGNYILLFDDMWHSTDWFLQYFLKELKVNGGGGAVIVTSRIKKVAEKMAQNNMHIHLKPWDDYKESGFVKARDLGN